MRYLADLVKSLNEQEKETIICLPLKGKELELLQWAWQHRYQPLVHDVKKVCSGVNITENTLFKISSILCNKIYHAMAPDGDEALLWWLLKRHLAPHLYHEMKLQEKKFSAIKNRQQLLSFFTICFEGVQKVPVKYYEEKRAKYYAGKLLSVTKDVETEAYIRARLLSTNIYVQSAGVSLKKSPAWYRRELAKVETLINRSTKPCLKGKFYLYRAWFLYYIDVEKDMPEALASVEKMIALFKEPGNVFSEEDKIMTACRKAETLYGMSRFTEAMQNYNDIFAAHGNHLALQNDVYHHTKWVQLLLINDDTEKAKSILTQRFLPFIEGKHPSILTMGCISFAKYYLLQNQPDKALGFIQTAFEFNKKNLYVQYEIELRYLQNVAFAIADDKDFTIGLVKKNLRYLRNMSIVKEDSSYPYFFYIIEAVLNNKQLTADMMEYLEVFNTGYFAVYGRLLLLLAKKYKHKLDN